MKRKHESFNSSSNKKKKNGNRDMTGYDNAERWNKMINGRVHGWKGKKEEDEEEKRKIIMLFQA